MGVGLRHKLRGNYYQGLWPTKSASPAVAKSLLNGARPTRACFQQVWPPFSGEHRAQIFWQRGNLPQQSGAHPLAGIPDCSPKCWADSNLTGSSHTHFRQRDQQQREGIPSAESPLDELQGDGGDVAILLGAGVEACSGYGFGLAHPVGIRIDGRQLRADQMLRDKRHG